MAQAMLAGFSSAPQAPQEPASGELPRVALTPRCFQTRRLVLYRGAWYVYPNEEPRPGGEGKGEIQRGAGFHGFAEPRLEWQSELLTSSGAARKPQVITPQRTCKSDKPIPFKQQLAGARARSYDQGRVRMDVAPIVAGVGSGRRVYKRPVVKVAGERSADRGKALRQLEGGPVWWRSRARLKDGRMAEPKTIDPLTEEQVAAIEFELWLRGRFKGPLERFLYLVREHNALVIVNHSGGKDSQAMYLHLTRDLGVPRDQIKVVHADLPNADWPGTLAHVKRFTDHPIKVVQAKFADGALKELYDYVLKRGKFPSAAQRYCTSDLKTSPINAWIRQALCELNGLEKHCEVPPGGRRIVISTMGMRAQESDNRAGLAEWELNVGESIAGRLWFEYLPIHRWTTKQVFESIKRHGQEPFWIYGRTPEHCRRLIEAGSVDKHGECVPMQRMSCVFCIMGSLRDIGVASKIGPPEIAEKICKTEVEIGHTLKHGFSFPELQAKGAAELLEGPRRSLAVLRTARERKGPCK
jgi:DNA sulfur modification protein DndC